MAVGIVTTGPAKAVWEYAKSHSVVFERQREG
jgi:cephalosporin hydroxylase